MKKVILTMVIILLSYLNSNSQNITNTLGTNGSYLVRSSSDTIIKAKQTGIDLLKNVRLKVSTDTAGGIIFKGPDRFMHDYSPANLIGKNTFLGVLSGSFHISGASINEGSLNTGIGAFSLSSLTEGYYNTSTGASSLQKLTTGEMNTSVGYSSQYNNTTGARNTSVGTGALYDLTTGSENSAFGTGSLGFVTTGYNNTAIGHNSGSNLLTGGNNTLIGNNAQPTISSVSNQITLGNNNITSLRCNVQTITSLSDMRDKKDVDDLSLGLEFIAALKPRQFRWDKREWYENNVSDGSRKEETLNAGFLAQELDDAQIKNGAAWLNLVNKDNPERIEATYGNLLPVIVKAVQELKTENDGLRAEINDLRSRLEEFIKTETESLNLTQNK